MQRQQLHGASTDHARHGDVFEPVHLEHLRHLHRDDHEPQRGSLGYQQTIFATLAFAPATLVSAAQWNAGAITNLTLYTSKPIQQRVNCTYSDSAVLDCTTGDSRGSAVTAWSANFPGGLSVGAIGSTTPGLVSPLESGTYTSGCTVTGGIPCSAYTWTIIYPPLTSMRFSGMTLSGVHTK